MASSSSSQRAGRGELILVASQGGPVTAYDALSGDVVAELTAANTPRHGLAVAAGAPALVAASHVCPATGAGSVRLHQWWSPASVRSLPVPEPVAPLLATPCGSHLLAGGLSGRVHALGLPSGELACSFRAHRVGTAVSCLALNDDGSLLVSGGEDGEVAAFPLIGILDVDAVDNANDNSTNLAVYAIAAHVAPVTCVACGHGGCNAVFASASTDGTCKVWNMADGAHLRSITLSSTTFSLALDPTTSHLFAGGSDGCVLVASLDTDATMSTWHASGADTNAAVVGVGMANGCKNLVSCTEDGEVRVWDLTSGSLANTFWSGGAVSDVLVIKRLAGDMVRDRGGEGFRIHDGEVWTTASEAVEMGNRLRASEVDRARSVELVEMAVVAYKRSLRLMLREVTTVANGRRANGTKGDGHVND